MTQEELRSYRLTSMEEPSDEMLQAIMEQVAESARRSTAKFQAELHRRFEAIRMSNNAYMSNSQTKYRCTIPSVHS